MRELKVRELKQLGEVSDKPELEFVQLQTSLVHSATPGLPGLSVWENSPKQQEIQKGRPLGKKRIG